MVLWFTAISNCSEKNVHVSRKLFGHFDSEDIKLLLYQSQIVS